MRLKIYTKEFNSYDVIDVQYVSYVHVMLWTTRNYRFGWQMFKPDIRYLVF